MAEIENIKDTIAKVLALADSPNEHEARAALMKARELMAKYKLREEDVRRLDTLKVIDRLTGITCTKMTNTWAVRLSAIIAEHYCCKSYRHHIRGEKKVTIGLVGLEDDYEVCLRVFRYAYDSIVVQAKRLQAQYKECNGATLRQMGNAYGDGFCDGLVKAYRTQDVEHQEYALVLVTPQPVVDAMSRMKEGGSYGTVNYEGWRMQFAAQGYQDGQKFDPAEKQYLMGEKDMSECMEIASGIAERLNKSDLPKTMDEARQIVKAELPDEGVQLVDNVAEFLFRYAKRTREGVNV